MAIAVQLLIDGVWRAGSDGETRDILNPATNEVIGTHAVATRADLDEALAAANRGFKLWRGTSAFDRCKILRAAAALVRDRVDELATVMTSEQGKPVAEARIEIMLSADLIDWFAEEGRRAYGRLVPARLSGVKQSVLKEPIGPVAAFTPWNFPISQVVRKVGPALSAGCSMILKAAEDTPASPAAFVKCFVDAGLPKGVLNLVYGDPAAISAYLVPHPVIRKISFTGSVPVGKLLAALAGQHMKKATMELGGHSPVMIFDDADLESASTLLAGAKFRNAGQVCISPTRFLVQQKVYDQFVDRFTAKTRAVQVGNGLEAGTTMGPLVSQRRRQAVEDLINEARKDGAALATGGNRIGNKGNFFEPTVLTEVTTAMRVMNEEPFGPLALMMPFGDLEEAVAEANRLPYGLAAYAFSTSARTVSAIADRIETGMLTVNHIGLGQPETPFGGVKESGYGSEGGTEALEAYFVTKFVTHAA